VFQFAQRDMDGFLFEIRTLRFGFSFGGPDAFAIGVFILPNRS
jgi:hypothetical protein